MSNYNNLIITYSNGFTRVITLTGNSIGYGEYQNQNIVAVEVPECVTTIEEYAFCDNELSSITLNEGLEVIGGQAFQHGTYSAITIPSTVQSIGINAFNVSGEQDFDPFTVTCLAPFPPVLDDWEGITFGNPDLLTIYVPAESVEFYKSDWSEYADKIQAIPEPISGSGCYIGNALVVSGYVGNSAVTYMYIGDTQVFPASGSPEPPVPPVPVYSAMPLTFDIISGGTLYWKAQYTSYTTTIEYSRDNGSTWTSITSNTGASAPSISVDAGDIIQFRGYNDSYSSGNSRYNNFSGSSVYYKAYGNIMSLFDGDSFVSLDSFPAGSTYNLRRFFQNANLVDAENLVLPATALTSYCYSGMFNGCGSLTTAPELPATILAKSCYYYMFENCNLTAAPELPATTLAGNCYEGMFKGCTGLTTAPELPATTLAENCYSSMFDGCTNLNYIKCLATDIPATNCTRDWARGVASTGTFIKNPSMNDWLTGQSGIPNNWTVIDAQ